MYPLSSNMFVGSAFLLIWIIIIHFPVSTLPCLQDERSYLLDFKSGFNLSSVRLSSWRGLNCCEWEGVGCDYHTSHVIRLDLSSHLSYPLGDDWESKYLTGELRPSLFNLEHLQHLDLSGNNFQGISIPPDFSKLQRLTFLSLSNSGFEGEVPVELGNMSCLRHLYMSNSFLISNKFHVWVRNLRSLEFLVMDFVNLSMASQHWGEALSGLTNLTHIHLYNCFLSGKIPDLANLTRLSHLDISSNLFPFELPSWFDNASSLVSLDLHYCGLNGSIPSNFLARSRMRDLVLYSNPHLKGNLSFILSHSSSLVRLSISQCNLGGALPPSLANFSKLQNMGLNDNNFEGSIPSFGRFLSLEYMYLSGNQLSGHIPPSLGQLSKLSYLVLGDNKLSGTIPDSIANLTSLVFLSLVSNQLRGNFSLQLLENLTHLIHLDLSENQHLIDISTSWVPLFSNLQYIGLSSCSIEGGLPEFLSQQYQLFGLQLSDNSIVGNIPLWLWDLPSLQFLNLSKNQLEGSLPQKISNNFKVVDLHGNRLYGSLPAIDFVSDALDLSNNEFNGSIPPTIGMVSSLSLSGNNLTGQIPSFICYDNYRYYVLDLSKNKLIGVIPANIGRCSGLSVLKLAQNALQGEIPQELGNLTDLQTLNLNGNNLQGIVPLSLSVNCTKLQVLDLGNNRFEGSIPLWIEKLTGLRILSLASNKFTHRIPLELFRMQNLQILDLSGNQLSGGIPSNVGKLYAMLNNSQSFEVQHFQTDYKGYFNYASFVFKFADEVTVWIKGRATPYQKIIRADKFIDLSYNKLSGNIPPELGLLKGLISLNISKNNLSGSIPESLGAMAYLESLDLSENKLLGKIPSQLLNLTFLALLNLSNNMLSGLIPQGKQFSTFEASSFVGNLNLHGPQLENRTLSMHNHTSVEDGDGGGDDQWWAVGVGLCFGVGFATVISALCFHLKWRYICFANMDNLIYYLLER